MEFASADKALNDRYKLMIGCVVPRPIGFISTKSADGIPNLAPFSFFNAVSANPPTVAFSAGDRGTEMKDTIKNVIEHPEFIVHIVSEPLAEMMNTTSGDFGRHVNEFAESGLTAVPGNMVDVPRVAEALVALECRMTHHLRIGEVPPVSNHVLGEVLYWHIDDRIVNDRHHIDADALQAIGRMGGLDYSRTRERMTIERPVVDPNDPRSIESYKAAQAQPLPK